MCNTTLPKTLINAQQLLKYPLQGKFAIINNLAVHCPIVLKFDTRCIMRLVKPRMTGATSGSLKLQCFAIATFSYYCYYYYYLFLVNSLLTVY